MKKLIKSISLLVVAASLLSLVGCSKKEAKVSESSDLLGYADVELGKTYTDVTASIKFLTCRTDMCKPDYPGKAYDKYIEDFNKMYPNIKVEVVGITDYASQTLLYLQGAGDWGDIMMIPQIDKKELHNYFVSYGKLDVMKEQIRFAEQWMYDNEVYGIACDGNAQGVLYNKKVFEKAGITTLPKTPDEFIDCLKKIKANTDAIPLYTNYAAGWTMGAWDAYLGGSATGDADYMNRILPHEKDPFRNRGDNTHAYAVYKVLYDAVANGLIEDDYTTTDWEGCKGMINRGEIGTMVLGSWAFSQMQGAGPNPQDIGYMSFPISVNGKQSASAGPDYNYGINKKASIDNQKAAMVFVKWLTEKSGYAFNEGCIPVAMSDNKFPAAYDSFNKEGVALVVDNAAVAGEEDLFGNLNSESELNINAGGNLKVQQIIEHAANKTKDFDAIMDEWNAAWATAQNSEGAEIKY